MPQSLGNNREKITVILLANVGPFCIFWGVFCSFVGWLFGFFCLLLVFFGGFLRLKGKKTFHDYEQIFSPQVFWQCLQFLKEIACCAVFPLPYKIYLFLGQILPPQLWLPPILNKDLKRMISNYCAFFLRVTTIPYYIKTYSYIFRTYLRKSAMRNKI